jgi:hypothetical protein
MVHSNQTMDKPQMMFHNNVVGPRDGQWSYSMLDKLGLIVWTAFIWHVLQSSDIF